MSSGAEPTRDRRFALALALLAALPVALIRVPDMADLPNHIARHHLLAQSLFGGGSPWWTVGWRWIGNLGVDLPAVLLTPLLGAELATRLMVMLIAPLTVLALLALGRAAHGRLTPGVALALPFAFAQPWFYGLVNYELSVALALFVAAAWLRRPPTGWARALGYGLAALGVWTAHVMGWGILVLLVAGAELARAASLRDMPARARRAAPLLVPLIPMLLWRGQSSGPAFTFAPHLLQAKAMNFATVLKGLSLPFDLAMTLLLGALAAVVFVLAAGPRVEPRLGIGAALLLAATLALPTTMLGSWGADLRLAPVAVMIAFAALAPVGNPRLSRWLVSAGLALFVARALVTTIGWYQAQPDRDRRLALLRFVPERGRLGFVVTPRDCRTPWRLSVDRKLGSYAVTRRDAFVNTLFLIPGADLVSHRRAADAAWFDGTQDLPCAKPGPALIARLAAMRVARFDAIWLVDAPLVPLPAGYRIAYRDARDTILVASRLE